MIKDFKVYVPGRISGFFEIVYKRKKEKKVLFASRGAGPNLELGGFTRIKILNDNKQNMRIFINGKEDKKALTSINLLKLMLPENFSDSIEVHHDFNVPVGCGFGSSSIGALGLAISLNYKLGLSLTLNEIGEYAHKAEVISRTGLGTVGPQLIGGLTITKKAGPPGSNIIDRILLPSDYCVLSATFGPIKKEEILLNETLAPKIVSYGGKSLKKLLAHPSVNVFLEQSRSFAEATGLIPKNIKDVLHELDKLGKDKFSMNMIGQTIFSIVKEKDKEVYEEILKSFFKSNQIFKSKLNYTGPLIKTIK